MQALEKNENSVKFGKRFMLEGKCSAIFESVTLPCQEFLLTF